MKKYRLFLPLLSILMIGCGSSDSSKKPADTTPEPLAVYDFSEFIVPPGEIYYTYNTISYEKDEGDYVESDNSSFYRKYHYNDNGSITILDDDIEQKKIIISANDIIIENLLDVNESSIELERNVSIGDVIFSNEFNETRDNFGGKTVTDCTITKYLDEKVIEDKNISNVLEKTCISQFKGTGSGTNTREDTLTVVTYFAKNSGEVSSVNESCIVIKWGDDILENNCTKVETTLNLVIEP